MDALLNALYAVCVQLLPIIGAVVLVFLCIFLRKLWKLIDHASDMVVRLNPTINLVDQSIEKVQAPLDTAVKYSKTLDNVHDKTVESVNRAAETASENVEKLKDFVVDKFNRVQDAYVERNVNPYIEEEKNEAMNELKSAVDTVPEKEENHE
ncbi:MAG: hypothetical protein IIZ27_02920 [Solobacterium sp.]|nr:hypothetical protein [Solobacterium sp.]MBR2669299.1 hypothetical protein [Solobacterium sp.]